MMAWLHEPTTWVLISFIGFVALAFKPAKRIFTQQLDNRAAAIKHTLEEAAKLRDEAKATLAAYQTRQRESLKEAEDILAQTKAEAERMGKDAEENLKASLDNRMKVAMEKIAQAETRALKEVQAHVVDIAISAARSIIIEHLDKTSGDDLIKVSIADIERKLH